MPQKRKSSLSRDSIAARKKKELRADENEEQREIRLLNRRIAFVNAEADKERDNRLNLEGERLRNIRNGETTQQRNTRIEHDRVARRESRGGLNFDMQNEAFIAIQRWSLDYSSHFKITIGRMDVTCSHCKIFKRSSRNVLLQRKDIATVTSRSTWVTINFDIRNDRRV